MLDNLNFIDLVALTRITPESTVERFGGTINSSFFDASNILGTLKQKGLVTFVTAFPSQSALSVTEEGKKLIDEVKEKAKSPFDNLDMAILTHLSNGKRTLNDVTAELNVTSKDLAFHLYKMSEQEFISYELRNGNMTLMLTEKGFLKVKEGSSPNAAMAAGSQTMGASAQQGAAAEQNDPPDPKALEMQILNQRRTKALVILVAVVIAVIALLVLKFVLKIF